MVSIRYNLKIKQFSVSFLQAPLCKGGCRDHDCMVVWGFTTTFAISAYHHWSCEFESRSDEMYLIQHYVIKVVSDLRQRWRFFLGTLVFSTNKTDCYDITEILLKIALNTITLPYATHCVRVYHIYFILPQPVKFFPMRVISQRSCPLKATTLPSARPVKTVPMNRQQTL